MKTHHRFPPRVAWLLVGGLACSVAGLTAAEDMPPSNAATPSAPALAATDAPAAASSPPSPAATAQTQPAPQPAPLTLAACYALALQRSEQIAIQQEILQETGSHFAQALSGILPRVSFASSDKRQDGNGSSSFNLRYVPERKFVFSQPLFSGFKEFAAMRASRAEHRERAADTANAERRLLVDVSDAFHWLLQQREDARTLETIRTTLNERIAELQQREQLGRSRASEVASADAELRRVEAEIAQVRSQEITARQLLEFLTGRAPLGEIADTQPAIPSLDVEDAYLAKALTRADVQAAEAAWQVAEQQVGVARGDLWPTVSVGANYYTQRAGASHDVDWDATLQVNVPIFQGGSATAAVRGAASRARQAQWRWTRTRREAELEIRDLYAQLAAALDRNAALDKAAAAAEHNYRLQMEDYQRDLVSNLEVLQALRQLQEARREVISAASDAKRLYWRLRAATGALL